MIEVKNIIDTTACPSCGEKKITPLFSVNTSCFIFEIVQCTQCGLCRTSPFPTDDILGIHDMPAYYGYGKNKFIPFIQDIRDSIMQARAKHFLSMLTDIKGTPKILDIGCSEGRLLKSFLKFNCQCFGVEHPDYPSERLIYPDRIEYFRGDLENSDLEDNSFDLIFLWHVLEHMDDPAVVMAQVCRLLAPEGLLILAVPNFLSMEAKAFKQFWFHLDIPWHKYHFDVKSMGHLLKKQRLKIIKYSTFCLEQGPFGIIQSVLNNLGFPQNCLYEALKGNSGQRNSFLLTPQILFAILLIIPTLLFTIVSSSKNRGSVLKLILKKQIKH
jgi:SAM-dependent methyltransferase